MFIAFGAEKREKTCHEAVVDYSLVETLRQTLTKCRASRGELYIPHSLSVIPAAQASATPRSGSPRKIDEAENFTRPDQVVFI